MAWPRPSRVRASGSPPGRSSTDGPPCTWPSSGLAPSAPARSPRRCGSHPSRLRIRLVPGSQERLRFPDAQGGFYLGNRTALPQVNSAPSVVIYNDGQINVGAWGTDVAMTPSVKVLLHNLVPLIDKGTPSLTPGAAAGRHAMPGNKRLSCRLRVPPN
jgi:hypothetical protein